jgi:hypothetical protein
MRTKVCFFFLLDPLILLKTILLLHPVQDACHRMHQIIDTLNVDLYKTYDEDVACILSSIENTLRYKFLAEDGPRATLISSE